MAPVLIATLSAPARNRVSTSSTDPTPPPTVSRMKTLSAVRRTTSSVVSRPSADAEMSRKVSSSAPSASTPPAKLDRITRIAQRHEVDAFHDAATVHIEARNNTNSDPSRRTAY